MIHDADGNRLAEYEYYPLSGTSTLLREYTWMDGEAVGVVENDTLYFIRTDHIGRPVFATDELGGKIWEVSYLPFGRIDTFWQITPLTIGFNFPGQWYQTGSGLHQNWMRDYDPTTGRYLQADPLGLIDGPSVYGYALQNPGKYVDSRGTNTIPFPANPFFRIGPRTFPRGLPRSNPFGEVLPPPVLFRDKGVPKSIDDPRAQYQHDKYKRYCDNPPPNTGDYCTDLVNRANYHLTCAKMKEDWDNQWRKGTHKPEIGKRRQKAQELMSKYYVRCGNTACLQDPDDFVSIVNRR